MKLWLAGLVMMTTTPAAMAADISGSGDIGLWGVMNNVSSASGFVENDNYGNDYAGMSFAPYVTAIDEYPDHFFDLVLVDGRSRKFCLEHAITKTRPGGFIVMDNSSTQEYLEFYSPLEKFPRCDITGIAPFWPPAKWQATRWQI